MNLLCASLLLIAVPVAGVFAVPWVCAVLVSLLPRR